MYCLTEFLWIRSPGMSKSCGSDSGSVMKLQARCQRQMQSSEGLLTLEALLPNSLTRLLAVGLVSSPGGPHLRLLITRSLFSPKEVIWDRQSVFYNLISDETHHHLCHIVLGTQINLGVMWEGTTQGCEYQGSEITGAILKLSFYWMDWTPASQWHLRPDSKLETKYGYFFQRILILTAKHLLHLLNASCSLLFGFATLESPISR